MAVFLMRMDCVLSRTAEVTAGQTAHSNLLFAHKAVQSALCCFSNSCNMYSSHTHTRINRQQIRMHVICRRGYDLCRFLSLSFSSPIISSLHCLCLLCACVPSGQRFIPKQRHDRSQTAHLASLRLAHLARSDTHPDNTHRLTQCRPVM